MQLLSAQDLKAKLDAHESLTLIDLQPKEAYAHRHIPGAVQPDSYDRFGKEDVLVVYGEFDELGKGSAEAEKLAMLGFTNVYRLTGGVMGWMEAGYPVEGGQES